MKLSPVLLGLTALNLAAAVVGVSAVSVAFASPDPVTTSLVRTQRLEIVDKHGVLRGQISMDNNEGEIVFRLCDEKGQIRVKIGSSKAGSGIVLLDESTEPGVHILSGADTKITLAAGGASKTFKPKD